VLDFQFKVLWTSLTWKRAEQADIDPREIEVVEAASGTDCNSTFQFWRFSKLEKNHPSRYREVAC
jgi:hypothetical protein